MDDETHITPVEFIAQVDMDAARRTCNAAFINHGARDVNIRDCITNVSFTTATPLPDDFPKIPLGDIDLLHEIHVDYGTGVVNRPKRGRMRRVHSARAGAWCVTAVMYQGEGAKEEWRRSLEKHMRLRHPHIVQIYGTASSQGIHATLYHDELTPLQHFLDIYRDSPILTVYVYACINPDFNEAGQYIIASQFLRGLTSNQFTFWIRRSTGRLCAEFIPPRNPVTFVYETYQDAAPFCMERNYLMSASVTDAMVINGLPLKVYHDICASNLGHRRHMRYPRIPTRMPVNLGSLVHFPSSGQSEGWTEISSVPLSIYINPWVICNKRTRAPMEDGWTRFHSSEISNAYISIEARTQGLLGSWFSQANHIFSRLSITSNLEDYALVETAYFMLRILPSTEDTPAGFLFLCPKEDFRTGPSSLRWPDCSDYWSLDPSGVERLSTAEAARLGFPTIQQFSHILVRSWDDSVYAGLHEHDYGEQSPFTENRVTNVEAIPSKRPFEDTATGTHENPTTQLGSGAQRGDELALRRLILDEKAQLIEMYRLGIFTKEEFLVRLDKIEAHYDAMRPPPTKRARLSN
ncbi:hypothetical protein MVEN_01981100 [Mycena venus]|uniref:Protein kinase domain-containing protein n=1 Tax=Mycena venus TaxID=2733690 RepID=A0A8H6XEM5_9AGAR|nr:hypothetical protein MVEN_01981100 [Mycena venus]